MIRKITTFFTEMLMTCRNYDFNYTNCIFIQWMFYDPMEHREHYVHPPQTYSISLKCVIKVFMIKEIRKQTKTRTQGKVQQTTE